MSFTFHGIKDFLCEFDASHLIRFIASNKHRVVRLKVSEASPTRINAGCWYEIRSLSFGGIKATLFNHSKHIVHVLDHDPGHVGDGVDIVFGVVGVAGARHQVQVIEYGVQAFADAVVKFAEWGVAVDEEDGVVGGELGHGDEATRRIAHCHWIDSL